MNSCISEELFNFLLKLEQNNNREWFNENKEDFKKIEKQTKLFFNDVLDGLRVHDDIENLKVFRIYRDVRFSKNKAPYKVHFSGSFARKKPELRGSYYLHLSPNNRSFIATGFWDPNKEDLLRIRKEFEMDDTEIREIISNKNFKEIWGHLKGDELKTAPRGFDKEHASIDLIRKKQYIFTKNYSDQEVQASGFLQDVNSSFKAIRPFFNYMSEVLTTNLNGETII
ncbi:MAG: DUF2461 domain-containing protein [Xanthomarina sp.]